jgi:hypothetical protein
VKDCLSLFEEILNGYISSDENPQQATQDSQDDRNELLSQVAEYEDGFNAWTAFASVFAASDQSLEYRIRNHKETHDIIIRLLELLRQNLFFGSSTQTFIIVYNMLLILSKSLANQHRTSLILDKTQFCP